jgi:hypothetical protein
MAIPARTRLHHRQAAKIVFVALLVFVSSYCSNPDKQIENVPLTPDESYLVDVYVRIDEARELRGANYEKSESLFAVLDSTIDRDRLSNTISRLNSDPDRWIAVYREIEKEEDERSGARSPGER